LPCGVWKVTPQGKGGGDAFCLTKFKDFANSSTDEHRSKRERQGEIFLGNMFLCGILFYEIFKFY
jgi:hypothetical protein